jgi:hypothetical protein
LVAVLGKSLAAAKPLVYRAVQWLRMELVPDDDRSAPQKALALASGVSAI